MRNFFQGQNLFYRYGCVHAETRSGRLWGCSARPMVALDQFFCVIRVRSRKSVQTRAAHWKPQKRTKCGFIFT